MFNERKFMSRPNQNIIEYLEWYTSEDCKLNFAIMLSGSWGSGKTHFIKNEFINKDSEKYIYISLNGVSSTDEIDSLLIQSIHPIFNNTGSKIAFKFANKLLKNALKVELPKEEIMQKMLESFIGKFWYLMT